MTVNMSLTKLLDSLTAVQRPVAGWNEGPLLLLAGPGSGKTRVLTARIARIFSESPESRWRMLALTFTTRAADEMRSRILNLVPDAEERLYVGTFHSFACEILRQSGTHLGIRTDFQIYSTQRDRQLLLDRAIKDAKLGHLDSADKLLPTLDRLRDRLIPPEECARYFSDAGKGEMVAGVYGAYDRYLIEQNALDFGSMIYYANRLFAEFPVIARKYRITYKYTCLDEFQDTNLSQYALIKSFAGPDYRNIFVVADDDQIIYQWNGASHQRLEQFANDFAPALFQMPTNFRCPPEVVALANRLVSHNRLRSVGKAPLEAGRDLPEADQRVTLHAYASDVLEAEGIAEEIVQRHGGAYGTVAVIARTKAILEGIKTALARRDVCAQIAQRRDSFASAPYAWLQLCLMQANRRSDEALFKDFAEAGNKVWGLEEDVDLIIASAKENHGDFLRAWAKSAISSPTAVGISAEVLLMIYNYLAESQDYRVFLRKIIPLINSGSSGFSESQPLFDEDVRAWQDLERDIIRSIGAAAGLDVFLQELEMRSKEPPLSPDVVALLTIHGSKGNEFDHVFLAGLAEDILPSFQSKKQGDQSVEMEEERRNCFVAITRCKETLTLSYASSYRNWTKQRSRFLGEMGL